MDNVNLVIDVQEIDEAHNCYTSRYLINKPIQTLYALQFSHVYQVSLFTELVKEFNDFALVKMFRGFNKGV
jgi:hypothetical protein